MLRIELKRVLKKAPHDVRGAFFNDEMGVAARYYEVRDLFHKTP